MRAFTCPRASAARRRSSPCTANGFIFHWAETAQRRHFITVTRGGAETGWHRGLGWTNFQNYPSSHCIERASSLCHTGRRFSLLEPGSGSLRLVDGGLRLFLKCWERVNEPWICAHSDAALGWQNRWQDSRRQSSLNLLYTKSAFDIPWQQSLICTRSSKKKQFCRRLCGGNALCSPSTWHSSWQEGLGVRLEGSQLTWAYLLLIKQKCQSRNNSSCVPPFF